MTVFETLEEPFILHEDLSKAERKERVSALLDKVGLSSAFGNRFPHEFSGGQRQRVGIARAIALNPKLVVLDEPVSALDVSVQAQILNLLQELQAQLALTYVFVAHDLAVVRHACEDIVVMYLGKVVERAPTEELFKTPQHPYTKALLSAVSEPDPIRERARKRIVLQGEVPSPLNPPSGCSFRTRCPLASAQCAEEAPKLKGDPKRQVACHHVEVER